MLYPPFWVWLFFLAFVACPLIKAVQWPWCGWWCSHEIPTCQPALILKMPFYVARIGGSLLKGSESGCSTGPFVNVASSSNEVFFHTSNSPISSWYLQSNQTMRWVILEAVWPNHNHIPINSPRIRPVTWSQVGRSGCYYTQTWSLNGGQTTLISIWMTFFNKW